MRRSNKPPKVEELSPNTTWISINDLMSGIIFLFMVILSVLSFQFKQEQVAFTQIKEKLRSPMLTRLHILKDLEEIFKKEGLEVEVLPTEGILRLNESTLGFPAAKALPNDQNLPSLGKIAHILTQVLPCYSQKEPKSLNPFEQGIAAETPLWCSQEIKTQYQCNPNLEGRIETIMIEGHTDSTTVRTGYKDNLALSAARATTVLRLMKSCTTELDTLSNSRGLPLFAASGYSYLRPLNADSSTDPKNRRIDIRFVMDPPAEAILDSNTYFSGKKPKDEEAGTKT